MPEQASKTSIIRYNSYILIQEGLLREKSLDLISLELFNYFHPPAEVFKVLMKFEKNEYLPYYFRSGNKFQYLSAPKISM